MASYTDVVDTHYHGTTGTNQQSLASRVDATVAEIETDVTALEGLAPKKLYFSSADGTAHSDSTDETATLTLTIPANTLAAGDRIEISGAGTATATNSTDTLIARLRIGGVSGTVVAATSTADVANDDDFVLFGTVHVDAIGGTGEIHAYGLGQLTTSGEAMVASAVFDASLDTTAAVTIVLTLDWSVADAGNSALGKDLKAIIYPSQE